MRKKRESSRNRKPQKPDAPASRIANALDIPPSVICTGLAQMELSGNREAVIDGCQGILEYDDTVVKLDTGKVMVRFIGRNMQIKSMTAESIVVTGFFNAIEFST